MRKKMTRLFSLRLMCILWLCTMSLAQLWADDTTSSVGSSNETTEELTFDFSTSEGKALISGLKSQITDWSTPSTYTTETSYNGFPITFFRCLTSNNGTVLTIRGDLSASSQDPYPGYVEGSMRGTLTQVKFTLNKNNNGNITISIIDQDNVEHKQVYHCSGTGEKIIDIEEGNLVEDAKSIKIAPDFKCFLSKIVMVRKTKPIDAKDPWIVFKKWNGEAYPTTDTETHYAPAGQIIKLESNGVEGFDPVSTANNPYVVVYTVNGKEPEFTNLTDAKGNWKNGNDKDKDGNAIGKQGYIYRRGIVLDMRNRESGDNSITENTPAGQSITVKLAIYKLGKDGDGNTTADKVKDIEKVFVLESSSRPHWDEQGHDITYTPDTKQRTETDIYTEHITKLDPTQSITVQERGNWQYNTILAKFSKNDKYDLQSLLNAVSVTPAVSSKTMKSSTLGLRKLSSMQYTQDGIACTDVAEGVYWFIPARKALRLELTAEHNPISIAAGSSTANSQITLKGYYTDDEGNEQQCDLSVLGLSLSNITIGDKGMLQMLSSDITYSDNKKEAYFTIQGLDNGTTPLTVKTEETSMGSVEDNAFVPADINFTAATTSLNITVEGSEKMTPPTISPYSCYYANDFNATVKGNKGVKTYYLLTKQSGAAGEISLQSDDTETTTPTESSGTVDVPPAEDIVKYALKLETDPSIVATGIIDGDNEVSLPIAAERGNHFLLCAVVADVKEGESATTITIENASRVVYSDYTYNELEKPVLTPGVEGNSHYYPYEGDQLEVSANVQTANCQIYYLIGNEKLTFTQNANGTITTNATLFNSTNPIVVTGTTMVQAIAYSRELGLTSDVVTYRYAKMTTDLNSPTFMIGTTSYTDGQKYEQSIKDKQLIINASYYDADGNLQQIDGTKIDWDKDIYHIYYTTDGSYPTSQSLQYTGPITNLDNTADNIKVIAFVYANGKNGDGSVSDHSTLNLLNANVNYWETTEANCPTGILTNNKAAISNTDGTLVDIEFGGSKDADNKDLKWKHYTSAEYATGNPLDNVGKYTIAPAEDIDEDVADVKDEMGNLYNHSKGNNRVSPIEQTHKATYGLPASGAYVKFEPRQNGKLTIWCCQEGALYYNNKSTAKNYFNKDFLRKRPAYFIDEAGKSYVPTAITAAGTLSANWEKYAYPSTWIKKGGEQNGIKQKLYTQKQTAEIYNMFNEAILNKGINYNEPIQNTIVYLNTEAHKRVAGFNTAQEPLEEGADDTKSLNDDIIDGTGVCLPSASYMKYTFDVKAGKTYFFFGWMTKIGIRGFGFEPDANTMIADQQDIYSGMKATEAKGESDKNDFSGKAGNTYQSVKLHRTFKADTWTPLVLPFSVSNTQLKNIFGDNVQVLHYRTIEGTTMYFFKHYHQMLVAGTPVLIKSQKLVDDPVFSNVTIEAEEVTDQPSNDYNSGNEQETLCMIGSYKSQKYNNGNYYVSSTGTIKPLNNTNGYATLPGTRAYIVGEEGTSVTSLAKTAFNNATPTGLDNGTTDIDVIDRDGEIRQTLLDGNIYNVNGQRVGSLKQNSKLGKGIYIVNGKKLVVE